MNKEKMILYIENCFLSPLINDEEVTDISYNGESIYYVSNSLGRKKADIVISSEEVKSFIRQLANLAEKQFSYSTPILDISVGRYRLNALHQSIGKVNNDDALTFSLRLASLRPRITANSSFLDEKLRWLFSHLLKNRFSIVIGGITGTGKTEFQKYLLRNLPNYERVVVIDNVLELDNVRSDTNIDLVSWQIDEKNDNTNISSLIRNALRSNPDWLVVAEARGKEMLDVLNSAMTGLPIITTLHAKSASSIVNRMERMVLMNKNEIDEEGVIKDINYHFHVFVYLEKNEDDNNKIYRYIKEIIISNENGKLTSIYEEEEKIKKHKKISKSLLSLLKIIEKDYFLNWSNEYEND